MKSFDQFKSEIETILNENAEDFNKLKEALDLKAKEKEDKKNNPKPSLNANNLDNLANEGFLALGKELAEADRILNTVQFKELKDLVLNNIGSSSASNLNKVIKIAKHPKLQNEEYRNKLPSGWGTLAIISTLKECEFEVFIQDETLTPQTSRLEITAKVNAAKGKEKTKSYTIRIDKNKSEEITLMPVEQVKEELKKFGWELVIPTEKTTGANDTDANDLQS